MLGNDGRRVASGTWDCGVRRGESDGMRYIRLRRSLGDLLDAYPDAVLAYEEVRRHIGATAGHVYGGITAMVMATCEDHGVQFTGIPVGTVKKHATGRGNAGKSEMMNAAVDRWAYAPGDDNEADALWIAAAYLGGLA